LAKKKIGLNVIVAAGYHHGTVHSWSFERPTPESNSVTAGVKNENAGGLPNLTYSCHAPKHHEQLILCLFSHKQSHFLI